jgi:hypothetical protein
MKTIFDMDRIIDTISYKDWMLRVGQDANGRMWMQWRFYAPNSYNGEPELQSCRKWFLSPFMPKSEVVTTAFRAALTAEEHECREGFKYKDQPIFGPHIDVDILHGIYESKGQEALDNRKKAS